MKTELLTTQQYSKKIRPFKKMNRFSVFKAAQNNRTHLLPGVINIRKVGTYYLLEVAV